MLIFVYQRVLEKTTRRKFAVSAPTLQLSKNVRHTHELWTVGVCFILCLRAMPWRCLSGTEQLCVFFLGGKKQNPRGRRSTWSRKSTQVGNEFFFKLRKFLWFSCVFQQILTNLIRDSQQQTRTACRLLSMPLFVVNYFCAKLLRLPGCWLMPSICLRGSLKVNQRVGPWKSSAENPTRKRKGVRDWPFAIQNGKMAKGSP